MRFCHFGTLNRPVVRAIWAEFLMAFFYTYVGCGALLNLQSASLASLTGVTPQSVLTQATAVALAFGLVTVAIGYIFGHVTTFFGNPAIVIAFLLFGKISILRAILSILFQIAGGIVAAALLFASYDTVSPSCAYIPNIMSRGEVFLIEMFITSLVTLAVAQAYHSYPYGWIPRNPSRPDLYGNVARDNTGVVSHTGATKALANAVGVGLAVAAAHFVAVSVTHIGLNPARAFGPAVISGSTTITGFFPNGAAIDRNCWNGHWVYWIGPIAGAVLGLLIYKFFLEEPAHAKDLPLQPAARPAGAPVGMQTGVQPGMQYGSQAQYVPPGTTPQYGTATTTPATAI